MQVPVIFLAFANDKVDNARYLRNLPQELDGIRKALFPAVQAKLCEVVERANVTIENILDIFQDDRYRDRIAILHYGGHADGYQLLLEQLDGSHAVAQGGGLVSFFSKQKGLKLVFFNGCSTHQQSVELMQAGIPAVVGTSNVISDDVATDLSIRFYKGIAQGMTLDRAWNSAVDEIKIKKGEGNTRGLYRKEAAKQMIDERFPWELLIREGSEIVKEFNLPSEVNNPLFGLPEIPKTYNLPEMPYKFLMSYSREEAEVFFGRAMYIRDLYNRITDKNSTSIISIYGQSGVGKSSIFDAGLRPRLENSHTVIYKRRIQDKGLLGTLKECLGIRDEVQTIETEKENLLKAAQVEVYEQKPITSITFDSFVESAFKPAETVTGNEATAPETFEGQTAVENIATNTVAATPNQEAKAMLIQELRILAEKSDVMVQGTIFKFIEDLTQAVETESNTPTTQSTGGSRLLDRWKEIEQANGKPLIIMLDHIEECYTRPMVMEGDFDEGTRINIGEGEIDNFLQEIKKIFDDLSNLPKGKLLLGYRKEYLPDFEEWFKWYKIPQNKVFIDNLTREEIIEIVQGITTNDRLKRNYQVTIENGLAEIIADDLLEERNATTAPILQMTLTKLWKSCEQESSGTRFFTIQKYQEFKKSRLIMEDFVDEQMLKLKEWNPKAEGSGLILDILMQHTTPFGTAETQSIDKLKERYAHKAKTLEGVLSKARELYLLVDLGNRTGLAHDTLALIIREKYRKSMYPAQRALRLLENKIPNYVPEDKNRSLLDERELSIVEEGGKGMRYWTEAEMAFVKDSQNRREANKRKKFWRTVGYVASVISVISFTIYSWYLRNQSRQSQVRAEASQLMTLAVQSKDMTMALRLAARADSLSKTVDETSMTEKLLEILSTSNFYSKHWKQKLLYPKLCISEEGNKMLYLDEFANLIIKDLEGKELFRMEDQGIEYFDLSADGRKILTSASDQIVRIWDMNGKQVLFFEDQNTKSTIQAAGFLADGRGFYVNIDGKTMKLVDFKGRQFYQHKVGDDKFIGELAFSPDGQTMLLALQSGNDEQGNPNIELQSWDIIENKMNYSHQYNETIISQLHFSPDGTKFVLLGDGYGGVYTHLYSTQGDTLAYWKDTESAATQLKFSADSKMLFTAHKSKIIKQYEVSKIETYYASYGEDYILPVKAFEENSYIDLMAVTPNGKWLLTANQMEGIKFWNLQNSYKITYGEINNGFQNIAFSSNGKEFFTNSLYSATLQNWQIHDDGSFEKKEIDLSDTIPTIIQFNHQAVLTQSDSIRLLDFDQRVLLTLAIPQADNFSFKLSPDGQQVILHWADTTEIWNKEGKKIAFIRDDAEQVFLSKDNQHLVAVNSRTDESDFTARVWSIKGKLLNTLKGHTDLITDVSFSDDDRYIATASEDQTAKIWDFSGNEVTTLVGHYQRINTVVFSPKSDYILTGSDDYTARLWNMRGEELNIFVAHKVNKAVFSPDGTQILTAGTHDFNQKDFFNISQSRKTDGSIDEEAAEDNYFVSSIILWDRTQDYVAWLGSDQIANFSLTDYLYAGASVSFKTLLSLENAEDLNAAGLYYMDTDVPISGVPQGKRVGNAKQLLEKALKIERMKEGVIGLAEVEERQKGRYNVEEMLDTKDTDELEYYIDYIYEKKLAASKNRTDSQSYWKGLKAISEKSLKIKQTPKALSTLKNSNLALGDTKANVNMVFSGSVSEMRRYADFFAEESTFKKASLVQAAKVYEHILENIKSTSAKGKDIESAAKIYNELAWLQLSDKEIVEAEKSVVRGLELDKNYRELYVKQILVYLLTNRNEQARKVYLQRIKEDKANKNSLKQLVKEGIEKLEETGQKIETAKINTWLK